jgi:DNA-binding NarL/FixJ family response regulator
MRAGLRLLIESRPGLKVIGEAGAREEAIALVVSEQPDIILLVLDPGDSICLDFLPDLLTCAPGVRVIVLTGIRDQEVHLQALRLGALGVVLKDQPKETILEAIEKVHAGEAWLNGGTIAKVLAQISSSQNRAGEQNGANPLDTEAAMIASLTKREREIINLISQGLKNQQIADRLFISEGTVRNHLTVIYEKLGVTDRFGLIIYATSRGLNACCHPIRL